MFYFSASHVFPKNFYLINIYLGVCTYLWIYYCVWILDKRMLFFPLIWFCCQYCQLAVWSEILGMQVTWANGLHHGNLWIDSAEGTELVTHLHTCAPPWFSHGSATLCHAIYNKTEIVVRTYRTTVLHWPCKFSYAPSWTEATLPRLSHRSEDCRVQGLLNESLRKASISGLALCMEGKRQIV